MLPILGCENKDGFNCKDAHATASALMADLAAAQGEVERLKSNTGCARNQRSTQFCADLEKVMAESHEQARLLGMSAERECALRGEVERLRRELAAERDQLRSDCEARACAELNYKLSTEVEALSKGVGCDALLAEVSYVAENLREWAREEFQPNCHPVTLTLHRAATVLEKIAHRFLAEKLAEKNFGCLVTAIGEYRAALDDIAELSESGDASSQRDFGDIARKSLEVGAYIQAAARKEAK